MTTTFQRFLDRINLAQPLSPVTMYYLGAVTAGAVQADLEPDGLLFEAVLHATDMQQIITRELTHTVLDEAEKWAAARRSR